MYYIRSENITVTMMEGKKTVNIKTDTGNIENEAQYNISKA